MANIQVENGVYSNLANAYPSGKTGIGGQRISNGNNPVNDLENGDIATKLVNAVEIDWNGAVLPNGNIANATSVTINTTGDLLKLIDDMQKEIYALAAAVIAIGSQVG